MNGSPGQSRWSGPGVDVATVPIALNSIARPNRFQAIVTLGPEPAGRDPGRDDRGREADERVEVPPLERDLDGRDPLRVEPPEGELDADPERLEGHRLPRRDFRQEPPECRGQAEQDERPQGRQGEERPPRRECRPVGEDPALGERGRDPEPHDHPGRDGGGEGPGQPRPAGRPCEPERDEGDHAGRRPGQQQRSRAIRS